MRAEFLYSLSVLVEGQYEFQNFLFGHIHVVSALIRSLPKPHT